MAIVVNEKYNSVKRLKLTIDINNKNIKPLIIRPRKALSHTRES